MVFVARLVMAAVLATITGAMTAQAQTALRIHESIAAPQRPLLCADRDSVNLIIPVLAKAADARGARDADKSQRLTEIATRLQGEVCRKAAADDIVILRCKLGQDDAGGTPLALVKMSALIQTEAAKGEQVFYGWTGLKIDDTPSLPESNARWCGSERVTRQIRVEERERSDGGAKPPAPEADEPFTPTPDIVLRVQQRLFDFGPRIQNMDGQLNQETVQSIQQFQRMANINPDGRLTRSTLIRLMTTPAPSPWLAIAFDGFGNFIPEIGRTRSNAEFVALEQLQRRKSSRDPKVVSVAAPNCIGFAVTRFAVRGRRGRTNFQAFANAGESLDSAAKNALGYCEREKGGGQCQVRYALCADGSGGNQDSRNDPGGSQVKPPRLRFDPEVTPANSPPPRFDPKSVPLNSAAPGQSPSAPTSRSDPKVPSVNSQAPSRR